MLSYLRRENGVVLYVLFIVVVFFPGQLQWNLHAEENTYCLRIIHNKHLKEGSMLR